MILFKHLPKTILILGWVSFFSDLSSEMIYPLLPIFLAHTLGAGPAALGIIEGVAESVSGFLKIASGIWTDRFRLRKPPIVLGYTLAGITRPLIGLALNWWMVLGLRLIDRVGKGLRTSPRDALIADVTPQEHRGSAYGFHRSMDHAGAVLGPLVAGALLMIPGMDLRTVFLWAAIPALITFVILAYGLQEPEKSPAISLSTTELPAARDFSFTTLKKDWENLGADFKYFLAALFVFTLGNSADAFLIVRLSQSGISTGLIATLWSVHHIVKMGSTYLGGQLSDRYGRRKLILSGWILHMAVYFGFAWIESQTLLIANFLIYGITFGLIEPAERSWISRAVPASLRGTAFGCYHLTLALAALPASVVFGAIWAFLGAPTAFIFGATLAGLAGGILGGMRYSSRDKRI